MVKFNFSSVFLTLTAASALVLALPASDESTSNTEALLTTSGELNVYDSVVVGDFIVASSFSKTVKGELTKPIRGFKIRDARFTWYNYKDF
ncbi:hypothetical protein AX14_011032, partial [Amanita brunnescens Koide BX004]